MSPDLDSVSAFVGAKLALDAFGPIAKQMGRDAAAFTHAKVVNVSRVLKEAQTKLRARRKIGGSVPLRVMNEAVLQACVCENELQASYLGGIIASSKSNTLRDDRAVSYLSLLNAMSSYQIRAHSILYGSLLKMSPHEFSRGRKWILRGDVTVILTEKKFLKAMELTKKEPLDAISEHIFGGLQQKGLSENGGDVLSPIKPFMSSSPLMFPVKGVTAITEPFRHFYPTPFGMELFLWGVGFGDKGLIKYEPALLRRIKLPALITPSQVIHGRITLG